MSKLKLGELFAGTGGLGLAVEEVFDAELAWYAEFDDAPSKIMAHHWPGVPNHRDVTTVDWASVEPVDIISGGSPCQDLSAAGRRAGMTEGTRSNLWVSMREAIATIKPTYVVWENVRGAYSANATSEVEFCPGCMGSHGGDGEPVLRALGRVLGDLHDLGFDAEWRGLPASDVDAPHARYRVFILATRRDATNTLSERSRESLGGETRIEGAEVLESHHRGAPTADTYDERSNRSGSKQEEGRRRQLADSGNTSPNSEHDGHVASAGGRSDGTPTSPRSGREREQANHDGEPTRGHTPNSEPGLLQTNWGVYAPAIRRWEAVRGAAPAPTKLNLKGKHQLNAEFVEWMMGLDSGHVTSVPELTFADQIKALGNGVIRQQAVAALKNMLEANK